MKYNPICILIIAGINLISCAAADAKFAYVQTRQVPISRLIKNLEASRADAMGSMDKALIDFRIGRLHAMAYAQKTEEAPADANVAAGSRFELPEFGHTPDHAQFPVLKASSTSKQALAQAHLKEAIKHMDAALKADSSLLAARLGLAWCYEQNGDKEKALNLYRKVFNQSYELDKDSKGGMMGWSISLETAQYLRKMLDPQKDKQEIARLDEKEKDIEKLPRYITPIALPLGSKLDLSSMLVNKPVSFDLDGFGIRRYEQWISPQTAWLVHDKGNSGKISSGLQLLGQSSFWVFWRNGYEVLEGLDDNRNGIVDGAELEGLAVWNDKNSNGVSDKGEVLSLNALNITGISTEAKAHPSGIMFSPEGIKFGDGRTVPSYDLILKASSRGSLRLNPIDLRVPSPHIAP